MDYMKVLLALIVIVNPVGAVPIFVGLTDGLSRPVVRGIIRLAAFTSTGVLVGAALAGEQILSFFGVSLDAFRVGGGILLLLTAVAMLHASPPRTKHTPEEEEEAAGKENIAVVPLAVPLLSGPGAISTVILYGTQAHTLQSKGFLVGACVLTGLSIFLTLKLATPIGGLLGKTGINIVSRLFGILLAAMGVEFITDGLKVLLPALGR